jgi:hypothetical protein
VIAPQIAAQPPRGRLAPRKRHPGTFLVGIQQGELPDSALAALTRVSGTVLRELPADHDPALLPSLTRFRLIITQDRALAAQAVALGVDSWVLVDAHDRAARDSSGPSRVFRQTVPGDWAGIADLIADELRTLVAHRVALMRTPRPDNGGCRPPRPQDDPSRPHAA